MAWPCSAPPQPAKPLSPCRCGCRCTPEPRGAERSKEAWSQGRNRTCSPPRTGATHYMYSSRITHRYRSNLFLYVVVRRVWAQEEDEAIRALVMKHGTKTWSVIAEQIVKEYSIQGRTGKQCRERWHNHLGMLF